MRVLLVSKFRRVTGGVETHLDQLRQGLLKRDHEVHQFGSEDVGGTSFDVNATGVGAKLRSGRSMMWSPEAERSLRSVVRDFRPDLVHYHSIYHQLSPSVLKAFDGPRVMTLHDYKLAAPCYYLLRDGEICELCVGRRVSLPAIRHRCVKGSAVASALCVAEEVLHRPLYLNETDAFIVPSRYAAQVFARAGVPNDRLNVVGWGMGAQQVVDPVDAPRRTQDAPLLFLGRLDESKGLDVLLRALESGIPRSVQIAGDGPQRDLVEAAQSANTNLSYLGWLGERETQQAIRSAAAVVIPSKAPETFGLSAVEALLAGTPVIHSGRGALPEHDGLGVINVNSTNPEEWIRVLGDPDLPTRLSRARADIVNRDLSRYSAAAMTSGVVSIYEKVLGRSEHGWH